MTKDDSAGAPPVARNPVARKRTAPDTAAPETVAPRRLGDLDLEAHLADKSRKQAFVTPMFDIIAPRYDAFTRLFSFGMDAGWKRDALATVVSIASTATDALDVACGTGDLAVSIAEALPNARVTALDASPRMIDAMTVRLREVALADRITTMVGDMCDITIPSASMDVVTAGYGVRNVPDAAQAVREMARVLRPGGVLVTLDFYRPCVAPWRVLLLWYLSVAGNAVGWWWHRDPVVYGYIARSIDTFMSWQQFSALLEREGFRVERVTRHLGGAIAIHEARKL